MYRSGSLAANVVYQQIKFNSVAGDFASTVPGLTTQSATQAGVSYVIGPVKLFGQYQYIKNSITTGDVHVNFGQLGTAIELGTGRILASDGFSKSGGQGDAVRNTFSIAYDYSLSKRTDVYAAFLVDHASKLSSGDTVGAGIRTVF